MPLACAICITKHGLRGSEVASLPQTEAQVDEHLEAIHHIPVVQKGETAKQAIERFVKKYPEAKTCEDCKKRGASWAS